MVGEAVSRITRAALTLGGAHGIFKTSRLEQLFRDGALGPLHPPPSDFCLYNIGLYGLGIDPADLIPPLKPAEAATPLFSCSPELDTPVAISQKFPRTTSSRCEANSS